MEPHRKTFDNSFGQLRLSFSANGSSLLFWPSVDCYGLDWATKEPAVLALRTLLKTEPAKSQLLYANILYGYPMQTAMEKPGTSKIVGKYLELTDAYETNPDDPANKIDSARFQFPGRIISIADIEPDFTRTGISYILTRKTGPSLAADVQAMRRAFLATADESLIPELNWALESLIN